jgi:hypothetical protein
MVRDQALQAGGLLNAKMGGPPVMPEQPEGVWNVEATIPSAGRMSPDRSDRRSVYTFIKRTATYPSFVTFDAADRQLSTARASPPTPAAGLVTLNDPVYHQAAEALAARMAKAPQWAMMRWRAAWIMAPAWCCRGIFRRRNPALRKLYQSAGPVAVASALLSLDAALTR